MIKFLLPLALAAISYIITLPVIAYTMSRCWEWFVASTFDVHPSMGAWCGIALIFQAVISPIVIQLKLRTTPTDKSDDPWRGFFVQLFAIILGSMLLLLVAYLVGSIFGWKS